MAAHTQKVAVVPGWRDALRPLSGTCARPLLVTTRSLLRSEVPGEIEAALPGRTDALRLTVSAHVPRAEVVRLAAAALAHRADMVVSLGGGSAIDAGKWLSLLVATARGGAAETDETLRAMIEAGIADDATALPHLAVPTTASGAEFTTVAGITDDMVRRKRVLQHPLLQPGIVVLEPAFTRHTPSTLWLSSAVRALDHAVEALYAPKADANTDLLATEAIASLFRFLPRSHGNPDDMEARAAIQLAAWKATRAAHGAGTALSHGIGYVLGGTFGVPHGICSCVSLAAVMQWNLPAAVRALAVVTRAATSVDGADAELAAEAPRLVRDLVASLDLPTRLRDLPSFTRSDIAATAELAFALPHVSANPRQAAGPQDMVDILELAW